MAILNQIAHIDLLCKNCLTPRESESGICPVCGYKGKEYSSIGIVTSETTVTSTGQSDTSLKEDSGVAVDMAEPVMNKKHTVSKEESITPLFRAADTDDKPNPTPYTMDKSEKKDVKKNLKKQWNNPFTLWVQENRPFALTAASTCFVVVVAFAVRGILLSGYHTFAVIPDEVVDTADSSENHIIDMVGYTEAPIEESNESDVTEESPVSQKETLSTIETTEMAITNEDAVLRVRHYKRSQRGRIER